MIKRVCDRCKAEVDGEFYLFDIEHRFYSGVLGPQCHFDLCPKCYKEIFGLIEDNQRG